MKDIPTEDLAAISAELHEAAVRVGCDFVSATGQVWPSGQLSGPPEKAARFVEFSWLRAAVVHGRAIFEDADPKAFAALLNEYGFGDEPYAEPAQEPAGPEAAESAEVSLPPAKVVLTAEILPATKGELERQARAAGLSVGEFLDWKFQPPAHL